MRISFDTPRVRLKIVFTAFAVFMGTSAAISGDSELNMDDVIQVVGKYATGHACPLSPDTALTAAHIVDIRWMDPDFNLVATRISNRNGKEGVMLPAGVNSEVDLGWVKIGPGEWPFYEIAETAPAIGEKIYWVEYNLKKKKKAFQPHSREAKVINNVAGHLFTDGAPTGGASGGCAFNADGKVVAIVVAGWNIGSVRNTNVGMFSSIYGYWLPELPDALKTEEDIDADIDDDVAPSSHTVY